MGESDYTMHERSCISITLSDIRLPAMWGGYLYTWIGIFSSTHLLFCAFPLYYKFLTWYCVYTCLSLETVQAEAILVIDCILLLLSVQFYCISMPFSDLQGRVCVTIRMKLRRVVLSTEWAVLVMQKKYKAPINMLIW